MSEHKPIGELAPTVSRSFDGAPDPRPNTCRACGQYHGGVNAAIQCLEREIDRLRGALRTIDHAGRVAWVCLALSRLSRPAT